MTVAVLGDRLSPWRSRAALEWAVTVAAGGMCCVIGWWRVSGEGVFDDQVQHLNLAAVGIGLAVVGNVRLITLAMRGVRSRRDGLLALLPEPCPRPANGAAVNRFVGGAGLKLYHVPGCALASARDWRPTTLRTQERAGRRPCQLCATPVEAGDSGG